MALTLRVHFHLPEEKPADAIVELVRGRGLATIRLSVVPENVQALEFYRRTGFAETGAIDGGEIVMERQL